MIRPSDLSAYYRNLGDYLGYPRCCVEAFISEAPPRRDSHFKGTGFVPCRRCELKLPEVLIDEIKKNRKHPEEFPVLTRKDFSEFFP
jgi:hypothetical protein